MSVLATVPVLDTILAEWRGALKTAFTGYRNHAHRVHHFACALADQDPAHSERIAIAAAFHDLGIWTEGTLDYLEPSATLARTYLMRQGRDEWAEEITAMIVNHHKITPWTAHPSWLVEAFRKADLVDLSLGSIRFGLSRAYVAEIRATFPNGRFHRGLVRLFLRHVLSHPTNPMPMMRL